MALLTCHMLLLCLTFLPFPICPHLPSSPSSSGFRCKTFLLFIVSTQRKQTIKSPVFTIVRNSAQQSLVNLHHAMEGSKHLHILVCKEKDAVGVQKQWPCHVIIILPHLANDMGQGNIKNSFILPYSMLKNFTYQTDILILNI